MKKFILILKIMIWIFYDFPLITYRKVKYVLNGIQRFLDAINPFIGAIKNTAEIVSLKTSLALVEQKSKSLFEKKHKIVKFKVSDKCLKRTAVLEQWSDDKLAKERQALINNFKPFQINEVKIYILKQDWFTL
jgi:hypothetical protein